MGLTQAKNDGNIYGLSPNKNVDLVDIKPSAPPIQPSDPQIQPKIPKRSRRRKEKMRKADKTKEQTSKVQLNKIRRRIWWATRKGQTSIFVYDSDMSPKTRNVLTNDGYNIYPNGHGYNNKSNFNISWN